MSCQLFPPLKIPLAKSGSQCVISSLTEVLGPAQLLLPGGKSLVPAPGLPHLAPVPVLFPSLHSRGPLSQLMFALGGPNTQQSALNFPLFVENCRFLNAMTGFKGKLQVNTKALIYILFTNNNICRSFSMCAHKRVLEDVWLFKTLWGLELVYQFKGSHFILFFKFEIA